MEEIALVLVRKHIEHPDKDKSLQNVFLEEFNDSEAFVLREVLKNSVKLAHIKDFLDISLELPEDSIHVSFGTDPVPE